jgi:hypothetical protein
MLWKSGNYLSLPRKGRKKDKKGGGVGSVADPGCLSRISDPGSDFLDPGSELFPSRIRIVSIPDLYKRI